MNVLCLGSEIVGPIARAPSSSARSSARGSTAASAYVAAPATRSRSMERTDEAMAEVDDCHRAARASAGSRVWIDYLSRDARRDRRARADDGGGRRRRRHARTRRSSRRRSRRATRYDEQLRRCLERDRRPDGDLLPARGCEDIRDALRPPRARVGRGQAAQDGYVSMEVDPTSPTTPRRTFDAGACGSHDVGRPAEPAT